LNFNLFGQPELTRSDVIIAPDGRVSYLQATDVPAAGLTIDELRTRVDEALSKYYRSPRTIITPAVWRSKKYYVLGKVVNKGVYTLDRPITILEAVARAQGLEAGLLDQNSVDLADLQRSFLVRRGERAPVSLEKLFYQGDLSQNVPIEPEDYLYIAPGNLKEVYVVGEVNTPGPVLWTPNLTVVGAIAGARGYNERAYKSRIVVVRGSLDHPLTYVVDMWKTFEAHGLDFKLEPRDLVYVSYRPFIRAEELLDLAISGFVQAATAAWVGDHVGPFFTSPVIK
jgi:protein involved in polysaccharide export with SLBB domain